MYIVFIPRLALLKASMVRSAPPLMQATLAGKVSLQRWDRGSPIAERVGNKGFNGENSAASSFLVHLNHYILLSREAYARKLQ